MAAMDMFASYLNSLGKAERKAIEPLVHNEQADLFAARSEEARLRIVQRFVSEAAKVIDRART